MLTPYDLAFVSPGTRLRARVLVDALKQQHVQEVCDCGCGAGILAGWIRAEGMSVIAFDIHPQLVLHAAAKNVLEGRLFVGSILEMPFAAGSLTNIVSADVIEHLPSPIDAFREFARVLAPGGKAILTIPNHTFQRMYDLFRVGQADIGHQRTYSRSELERILTGTGLRIYAHRSVCNLCVGMVDAAIAKLAILKYGKETVQHSEMTLRASSSGLAEIYYWVCKLCYPVLVILEHLFPSVLGTENLLILRKLDNRGGR